MRCIQYLILVVAILMSSIALAGNVTIPHEFKAGDKAVAAEVNANFKDVADAVNDNDSHIRSNTGVISSKQDRVNGTCAVGSSIRVINNDGSVECEIDDVGSGGDGDITAVNAGTGLTGGGLNGDVTLGIANGGVGSLQIADQSITSVDIGPDAVGQSEIAGSAVGSDEIIDGSISTVDLGYGVVGFNQIANDAINSFKIIDSSIRGHDIADGTITGIDIQDGSITNNDINVAANIDADKIAGMPGIDFSEDQTNFMVLDTPVNLISVSVTVPTAGWVFVKYSCLRQLVDGVSLTVEINKTPTPDITYSNMSVRVSSVSITSGSVAVWTSDTFSTEGVFQVTQGTTTFYVDAQSSDPSGGNTLSYHNLTAMFFPVQY